jgi:hypothetical protein
MSILAASAFFGEMELAQYCLEVMVQSLNTMKEPELVLDYVQFTESHYYGKLTTDLTDSLFCFLCRYGSNEEMVPIIAKLPEEWFHSVISSDFFFVSSEWERYKTIQRILRLRHEEEEEANESSDTLVHSSDDAIEKITHQIQHELRLGKKPILDSTIIFTHLSFKELKMIEEEGFVQEKTLQKALWSQHSLKYQVTKAKEMDGDLNIIYATESEHIMPQGDTSNIQEFKMSVSPLKKDLVVNHNDLKYPPFRFGVEFDNLRRLHSGMRLDSGSVFYAGSLWTVYIQKAFANGTPKLGIYLQRADARSNLDYLTIHESESLEVNKKKAPYIDERVQVRAWFKIFCYVNHNQCCVFESKPDSFKHSQSWGWRSNKLYQEMGLANDCPKQTLTCCVVMGIV